MSTALLTSPVTFRSPARRPMAILSLLGIDNELSVEIEEGKMLIIRLVSVGEADKDGRRPVTYELNGITREVFILDKSVAATAKTRPKADLAARMHISPKTVDHHVSAVLGKLNVSSREEAAVLARTSPELRQK